MRYGYKAIGKQLMENQRPQRNEAKAIEFLLILSHLPFRLTLKVNNSVTWSQPLSDTCWIDTYLKFSSVQSLSRVWLFATPWLKRPQELSARQWMYFIYKSHFLSFRMGSSSFKNWKFSTLSKAHFFQIDIRPQMVLLRVSHWLLHSAPCKSQIC